MYGYSTFSRQTCTRNFACPGVNIQHRGKGFKVSVRGVAKTLVNNTRNISKADPAIKKCANRNLIRCIEDCRHNTGSGLCLSGKPEAGVSVLVNSGKVQSTHGRKIKWFRIPVEPVRPRQRV